MTSIFEGIKIFYFPDSILQWLQSEIFVTKEWLIDGWLLVHLFVGLLFVRLFKYTFLMLTFLISFEIFENLILYPLNLTEFEPISNIILDIIVGLGGFLLAQKILGMPIKFFPT